MRLGWRQWSAAFAVALLLHVGLFALQWTRSDLRRDRAVISLDLRSPENLPEPVPVSLPSSLAFAWQLGAEPDATRPLPESVPRPAATTRSNFSATLGGQSLGLEALTEPAVVAAARPPSPSPATVAAAPSSGQQPTATTSARPPATESSRVDGGVSATVAAREPEPEPEPARPAPPPRVEPGPAPPDQVRLVESDPDEEEEQLVADAVSPVAPVPEPEPEPAPSLALADAPAEQEDRQDEPEPVAEPAPSPEPAASEPAREEPAPPTPEPGPVEPVDQPRDEPPDVDLAITQALSETPSVSTREAFPPPETRQPPVPRPLPPVPRRDPAADIDRALTETLDRLAVAPASRSTPPVEYRLPAPEFEPDPADRSSSPRAPNRNAEISRALSGVESQFGQDQSAPTPPPSLPRPSTTDRGPSAPATTARSAPPQQAPSVRSQLPRATVGRPADPRYDPTGRPGAYSVNADDFFSRVAEHIFDVNDRLVGRLPENARRLVLDVRFTIDRAGRVMRVELISSSGDARLDQAAREVIWRASPMPQMARDMGSETLELTFPVIVAR